MHLWLHRLNSWLSKTALLFRLPLKDDIILCMEFWMAPFLFLRCLPSVFLYLSVQPVCLFRSTIPTQSWAVHGRACCYCGFSPYPSCLIFGLSLCAWFGFRFCLDHSLVLLCLMIIRRDELCDEPSLFLAIVSPDYLCCEPCTIYSYSQGAFWSVLACHQV